MNSKTPGTTTKTNILLVEDNAASREILEYILSSAGYEVKKASGGEEALVLAATLPTEETSVILMDFQMPGLSGCRLAEKLRQQCKAEILAMSGNPISEDELATFDGFLLKPFDIPELKQQLEKTLQKSVKRNGLAPIQVLNEAIFYKLSESMDSESLRQIYDTCIQDASQRLTEIETAVARGDASFIRRTAHLIRGGCSMIGAEESASVAQKLETGSGERGEVLLEIENLRSAFGKLERILLTKFGME